ncbi:MAG: beta-propeller fold lactonase family protein [Caldilineaceae bacterium]
MLRRIIYLLIFALLLVPAQPLWAQADDGDTTVYLPVVNGVAAVAGADIGDADLTDTLDAVEAASAGTGAVYVMTNANDAIRGNEVVMYHRSAEGVLTVTGRFPTGGQGLNGGLGSQGAVTLSDNGRWLFVVNAGSNELSVFAVHPFGLELTDKVASGGVQPISVTVRKGLVYVLNGGDSGNIAGFLLRRNGTLVSIAGSMQLLSNGGSGAAPGPAQIAFTPDGKSLIVTEKGTNLIDSYKVARNGTASGPTVQNSAGVTPFGFAFARHGTLVVSEAFGGAADASAASSYQVDRQGTLSLVSNSVLTGQTAACWVVVTNDGKYAYTTNAGSSSLSLYEVSNQGELTLLNSRVGETGAGTGPTDATVSRNGRLVYALSPSTQTVIGFAVQSDGMLTVVGTFAGLPANAAGIAAW